MFYNLPQPYKSHSHFSHCFHPLHRWKFSYQKHSSCSSRCSIGKFSHTMGKHLYVYHKNRIFMIFMLMLYCDNCQMLSIFFPQFRKFDKEFFFLLLSLHIQFLSSVNLKSRLNKHVNVDDLGYFWTFLFLILVKVNKKKRGKKKLKTFIAADDKRNKNK